jgi:hypothetical protein
VVKLSWSEFVGPNTYRAEGDGGTFLILDHSYTEEKYARLTGRPSRATDTRGKTGSSALCW